jgi:starch-binding outer membrane protein, SusD/RagB family
MKATKILLLLIIIISIISCKKFVTIDPPVTAISSTTAFSNDAGAIATTTGSYSVLKDDISGGIIGGDHSIGILTAMEGDEFRNYNTAQEYSEFYTNSLLPKSLYPEVIWKIIYAQIHTTNIVVENLEKSTAVTASVKQQMIGEAKFMRAFLHFYAINLFGKVPLVITSNYKSNSIISRSEEADVYNQIKADLLDAQAKLPNDFVDGYGAIVAARFRPNKWTATALLSRVYLYQKDWLNAETESSKFKTNNNFAIDSDLINVFTGSSKEIIWQLQATMEIFSAVEGGIYILISDPGLDNPGAISPQLLSVFEPGDARFSTWVGKYSSAGVDYYYPFKYRVSRLNDPDYRENTTVFRLAEQYLISAEAKIQQGKIADGVADINILRQRARLAPTPDVPIPLPDLSADLSKEDALKAVMHERQVELFTEWGHRWFDLKRTGEINSVMTAVAPTKNSTWNEHQALWPIPQSEILLNSHLSQNEGYN